MTSHTKFQTRAPHSLRNDFGGTAGGQIFKNRTSFFGSLFWINSLLGETWDKTVETKEFEDYMTAKYPSSMSASFFAIAPLSSYPTKNLLTVADIKANNWSSYTPLSIPDTLVALGEALISMSPKNDGFQNMSKSIITSAATVTSSSIVCSAPQHRLSILMPGRSMSMSTQTPPSITESTTCIRSQHR